MSSVDLNVIIFMVLHKKARDGAGMVGVNDGGEREPFGFFI